MAISPREELRILSLTEFYETPDGWWAWIARNPDGSVQEKSEDIFETDPAAIADFFDRRSYDPAVADDTKAHYSRRYPIGDGPGFVIREYAYGAPEPYRA